MRADTLWILSRRLFRQRPARVIPCIALFILKGRTAFKQALASALPLDPAALPYHEVMLAELRSAFQQGQTLVLATGADLKVAEKVAQHLRVLHHVVASYGEESCVGSKKAQRLCQMFGAENFAYAGNSWVDVAVWRHARKIVLPFPLLLKRSLPLDNRPPEACCSDLLAPYCLSPPLQPLNL